MNDSVHYEERHQVLVKAFNERLRQKGEPHRFPESCIPEWLPQRVDTSLHQEYYLILDRACVHGGYILKYQDFQINGNTISIGNIQSPISEGIIDPQYTLIGAVIARGAVERSPLVYSLGMGGLYEPVTRLFHAMRWTMVTVPFYFKVLNSRNFLTKTAYLRRTEAMRRFLDACAVSGIGGLSIGALQSIRRRSLAKEQLVTKEIGAADAEIDALWEKARGRYPMIAVRDSRTVDILYPPGGTRFRRMKVYAKGTCIGWAVTLCTQMSAHKQFGSLRVGSIVDAFSHPDDAARIVHAAAAGLEEEKADIIVANHSHDAWVRAFRRNAFLRGPSNFIFGASVALTRLLEQCDNWKRSMFLMRGDGDGPINL